ncbi:hypothetical protein AAFC00_005884 [Neodothiora populina]|uniref:SPIN90/Ldb17 leucine-rich domain-containing protein n=1 Tax=Neodothiora populina TaxID=2781224 RepID=A0ABR3P669_9PEZI
MEESSYDDQQFWGELEAIVSVQSNNYEEIDDCLRTFIDTAACSDQEYCLSEYDLARCCYGLLESRLFQENKDYVRRQFVFGLLQEDDARVLHVMAAVLLHDGRSDEVAFEMMQAEGAFTQLIGLIRAGKDDDTGLHRLLVSLLGEMSRIQRLSWADLANVDDAFIMYLFQLIEELSNDANDPYHYPTIRVLLVLNEQYMCHAAGPPKADGTPANTLTNRIIKVLSNHGPDFRTFGENLILLLNRESALGPQLLILKLLYLLFTTPPTYEYFYTNDLHVLVDVIIRNLLDLDPGPYGDEETDTHGEGGGQRALRHTYLRVLFPLLKNTQLARDEGHYKKEELRKLLHLLVHGSSMHFAPADETVVRLVTRCRQVEWIREEEDDPVDIHARSSLTSPPSDAEVAKRLLGMNLAEAGESNLSILDVTAKVEKEKPMVPAPRRRGKKLQQEHDALLKPSSNPPSNHDYSGGRSPFDDDNNE